MNILIYCYIDEGKKEEKKKETIFFQTYYVLGTVSLFIYNLLNLQNSSVR